MKFEWAQLPKKETFFGLSTLQKPNYFQAQKEIKMSLQDGEENEDDKAVENDQFSHCVEAVDKSTEEENSKEKEKLSYDEKSADDSNEKSADDSKDLFSVFVGNLHDETTEEDLRCLFSNSGEPVSIDIQKTEKGNYAFLLYTEFETAFKVIKEMNGWLFKNSRIAVSFARECLSKVQRYYQLGPPMPTKVPDDDEYLRTEPSSLTCSNVINLTRVKEVARWIDMELIPLGQSTQGLLNELEKPGEASKLPPPYVNISTETKGFKNVYREIQNLEEELGLSGYAERLEKAYINLKQLFSKRDLTQMSADVDTENECAVVNSSSSLNESEKTCDEASDGEKGVQVTKILT